MQKFKALILGTDDNSYSVARSFYEAFGQKAVSVGAGRLTPYKYTKISDLSFKKGFSSNDDLFVEMLNEEAKKYPDTKFVIYVPNEIYMTRLSKNIDRLDFDFKAAYPLGEIYDKLFYKSNFYEFLEKIGVRYPKTQVISKDNIDSLSLDGPLFMKPDNFEELYGLDFENKKKGYELKSKDEAIKALNDIYKAGYTSDMIVQEFINGGDGSEYSINGYRSSKKDTSMVLARNLLSDKRPLMVGNHLIQVDHYDEKMYEIGKYIVDKLDYVGLFNFDFKVDSKTGEIFVLEMNQRQGRTFYYSTLAGVNLIELSIKDMVFGQSEIFKAKNHFRLIKLSEKFLEKHINPNLLDEFVKKERVNNTANPNIMKEDDSVRRKLAVSKLIHDLEKDIGPSL